MSLSQELLNIMKQFLDGNISANDFSFDFPARLSFVYEELVEENATLADLLEEDMPEVCGGFETDEEQRKQYPDLYFSEQQMREKVLEVYTQAQQLI